MVRLRIVETYFSLLCFMAIKMWSIKLWSRLWFLLFYRFRSVYTFYKYLLSRDSDRRTTNFISGDHQLLQYGRELEKLYVLSRAGASMDLSIPMELFVLDCTGINDVCMILITHFPLPQYLSTIAFVWVQWVRFCMNEEVWNIQMLELIHVKIYRGTFF